MTLKELSQLYYLKCEISDIALRLAELEDSLTDTSAKITGMPHTGRSGDRIGSVISEIYYLKSVLVEKRKEYTAEFIRLFNYIYACTDSLTRLILKYRFIDGMSWKQVADEIGGISESAAKQIAYRYIRKN